MGKQPPLASLRGKLLAIFASTGGHLEQAIRWADRLELDPRSVVVTFDSPQSRGLLINRPHKFIPYIAPRDGRAIASAIRIIRPELRHKEISGILSTGAGIALAAYGAKIPSRLPFYYIESISRYNGPSLTGRIIARLPDALPYSQHPGYKQRWHVVDNLLSDYSSGPARASKRTSWRIFVTLGTIRPYRFDSLVKAILENTTAADEITWQLGETKILDLPGKSYQSIPPTDFDEIAKASDVVVTHAGVGTILRLLDLGISPIAVPRVRRRAEHADNHQEQVAGALAGIGLLTNSSPEDISSSLLHSPRPTIQQSDARTDAS